MATNTTQTVSALPNPFTPLAFLPPHIADDFQASIYVSIATLSAFIWDWLLSITEEIEMCRKRKFTLPMAVYFLARIGTLLNCTMGVVFLAARVSNCETVRKAIGVSFIFAVPLTSTLFFFRVKAVYGGDKIITGFFGFLVFALFGLSFLAPFSFKSEHLGTTQRCLGTNGASYLSVPAILQSITNTLVFIAISLRIASYSVLGDTFVARMRSFMRGDGVPRLSRNLLQGGQMYYFATIGVNIAVIVLALSPLPLAYRTMFIPPHIALDNAMASRVFRRVRLGLITDVEGRNKASTEKMTTLRWAQMQSSRVTDYSSSDSSITDHGHERLGRMEDGAV